MKTATQIRENQRTTGELNLSFIYEKYEMYGSSKYKILNKVGAQDFEPLPYLKFCTVNFLLTLKFFLCILPLNVIMSMFPGFIKCRALSC